MTTSTLYFKVTLQTDIILNQKAASEGPNATLDFIPGNNFLGIVAGTLYPSVSPELALQLFHANQVRFGDAHLTYGEDKPTVRSLKVPAAMSHPKLKKASEQLYITYLTPEAIQISEQLKQCRDGFYDFTTSDHVALPITVSKNYAIKSAHDRQTRTSKEEMMYGYQSLQAGAQLLFSVEIEEPTTIEGKSLIDEVTRALTQGASKRIGRSRSAQYGLVKIERLTEPFTQVLSHSEPDGSTITIYADSRLIFIHPDTGLPCYQPTAEQLGLKGGRIAWEKSQIRTFQYSPWNFQRQCFDTDRCGIEKGSVIVVEGCQGCPAQSQYVGSYQNEGFGRVIYNPDFLQSNAATGQSVWKLAEAQAPGAKGNPPATILPVSATDSPLVTSLKEAHNQQIEERNIFKAVNAWKERHRSEFSNQTFASQWGTIRSIAMRRLIEGQGQSPFTSIYDELLYGKTGYLMHGVAAPNWEDGSRRDYLSNFILQFKDKAAPIASERQQCLALINLAAEMAKIYREKDNQ